MKKHFLTYYFSAKRGLAFFFLLLFLNGFITESMAFHWNDLYQSELIDLEGEKDSEEDNEKEKENKILGSIESLARQDQHLPWYSAQYQPVLSEEIHEVLSPPPDRS